MATKSKTAEEPKRVVPPREINVVVDGKLRSLKMSFGLQRELANVAGDVDSAHYRFMSADGMVEFMNVALCERDERGAPRRDAETGDVLVFDASYIDITPEDVDLLMNWIQGHVTDFFLRRLATLESTMLSALPEIERLSSSVNGSAASGLKTQ